MDEERDGVSAVWLCCFLRDAPAGTVVRGYRGAFDGIVVEAPAENPEYVGEMVELAHIHNDRSVKVTDTGKRWFTAGQAWEI